MKLAAISSTIVGRTGLAIIERALLGAVTIIAPVLLGRWGGPEELGLFAIFFPLVFVAIAFQESLVIVPYMIYWTTHAEGDGRRRYLGSVMAHAAILSAGAAAAFGCGAAWFSIADITPYAVVSLVLAAACPGVLLREFARRIVYAERKPGIAVAISGGVGVLQLAAMGCLYAAGTLTAATAFAAMGASSILGGAAWLYFNRSKIQFRGIALLDSFRRNWSLGGWSLGSQLSEIVALHMFPWLLLFAADQTIVGVYAACAVIASLPLPLHNALSNILVPEFVHVREVSGDASARRLMRQATASLTAVMIVFCLVVAVFSGQLLPWVYGNKFAGFEGTAQAMVVLALAQLLNGAALPAARALLVFKRPQQVFAAHLAGIVANFSLGIPMIAYWGIVGAAYVTLIGAAVKAALICAWYVQEMRHSQMPPTVLRQGPQRDEAASGSVRKSAPIAHHESMRPDEMAKWAIVGPATEGAS